MVVKKKTLKEYAEDAAARLKKSKNGSAQQKTEGNKSSSIPKKEKEKMNTKKT